VHVRRIYTLPLCMLLNFPPLLIYFSFNHELWLYPYRRCRNIKPLRNH